MASASGAASRFTFADEAKLTATIRRKVLIVVGNKKGGRKKEKKKGTSSHLTRGAEADGRAGRCLAFIRRHGLYY